MKVATDYAPTECNITLKMALIKWRQHVHAEFWGNNVDHFLGPAALVSDEIIDDLCHLSHGHVIHTIDDIGNNI